MTSLNQFNEAVKDARHDLGMAETILNWAVTSEHADRPNAVQAITEHLRDVLVAVDTAGAVTHYDLCVLEGLRSAVTRVNMATMVLED